MEDNPKLIKKKFLELNYKNKPKKNIIEKSSQNHKFIAEDLVLPVIRTNILKLEGHEVYTPSNYSPKKFKDVKKEKVLCNSEILYSEIYSPKPVAFDYFARIYHKDKFQYFTYDPQNYVNNSYMYYLNRNISQKNLLNPPSTKIRDLKGVVFKELKLPKIY